jgi:hypothetical protein
MKKTWSSKLLVAGLALVLVLAAGCDKPDANATLPTPTVGAEAVVGAATPGPNDMPVGRIRSRLRPRCRPRPRPARRFRPRPC